MARKLTNLTSASALSATDTLLVHQGTEDKKCTLSDIFDFLMPVGFMYTQYPGQSSPSEMSWPGTWDNVSSTYAGEFFRAEGGSASTFESGEQLDAFQDHTHKIVRPPWTTAERNASTAVWGPAGGPYTVVNDVGASSMGMNQPVEWDSQGTPRRAAETRPVNVTIRIWKRTA